MQMMYETIYKALVEAGLDNAYSPQDYLNFFCLGNREATDGNDTLATGSPNAANTPQVPSLSLKLTKNISSYFCRPIIHVGGTKKTNWRM